MPDLLRDLCAQDQIHLEGRVNLDEVRNCPKCGGVKSVRRTGRVEMNERKKTIWLKCDVCNEMLRNISVQVSNHIEVHDYARIVAIT
jgi:transcription elongation factor Elf1